ncbi:MAG: Gfo/Idh/MocA family protein [Vibrio sp.]
MTIQKLNIAVVGAGAIGKTHIELIHSHPDCQLFAIVDPSPQAKQVAEQYRVPLYTQLADVLSLSDLDGVILASPNFLHAEQATECIKANVPVIVEKPVTDSIQSAIELYRLSSEKQAKVLVGHHRAYSPILSQSKALIESGKLGKLVSIQGSAQFYKPDTYFEEGEWRTKKGGGPILINLIHEIGNMRYLMGDIESVQAISTNHTRGFEVEDTAVINLKFKNGALGSFIISDASCSPKSWEQTSQENPSYTSYSDEDCYHVSGTNGSLSIPTMRLKFFDKNIKPSWWNPTINEQHDMPRKDPLFLQLSHFCELIRSGVDPMVSVHDGLQNLLVVDAIQRACESQKIENIMNLKD